MDTIAIDDTLRSSSFTAGLGRSEHRRLAALATHQSFATGEVVLREGDETPFLGIVASGRLGLRLLVPDRGPITILTVEPGDVFGWSAERDDDLAAAIHPRLLKLVARRLDATRLQLLDLFGSGDRAW
jgi:CRP/FNR family cyclic AMP-dependent transcriptional regulator